MSQVDKSCEKHKPGTYLARAVDWGITQTKAGAPQVSVCFRYKDGDTTKDILWWGSFKDTVVERTLETLLFLGLKDSLEALADGPKGGALSMVTEAEIVIEHRQGNDGMLRAGVAWVNDPTKSRIDKLPKAEAGQLLGGANAVLARLKQNRSPAVQGDIPF